MADVISGAALEEVMRVQGLQSLQEHQRFQSFDGTIITENGRYTYKKDFNIGDWVSVYSEKLKMLVDLQITGVSKSISDGREYFDITFGYDRQKTGQNTKSGSLSSGGKPSSNSGISQGQMNDAWGNINQNADDIRKLLSDLEALRNSLIDILNRLTELANQLRALEARVNALENWKQDTDSRLDGAESNITNITNNINNINNNITNITNNVNNIQNQVDRVQADQQATQDKVAQQQQQIEQQQQQIQQGGQDLSALEARVSALEACCNEVKGTLEDMRADIKNVQDDLNDHETRIRALEEDGPKQWAEIEALKVKVQNTQTAVGKNGTYNVLATNSLPFSPFSAKVVKIPYLSTYTKIEIHFLDYTRDSEHQNQETRDMFVTTINTHGFGNKLTWLEAGKATMGGQIWVRGVVLDILANTLTFTDATKSYPYTYDSDPSQFIDGIKGDNRACVPQYIIGYRMSLDFDYENHPDFKVVHLED